MIVADHTDSCSPGQDGSNASAKDPSLGIFVPEIADIIRRDYTLSFPRLSSGAGVPSSTAKLNAAAPPTAIGLDLRAVVLFRLALLGKRFIRRHFDF